MATAENIFGRLISAHIVSELVIEMLQKWMDTYLAAIAYQSHEPVERFETPRSWRISTDMEKMPEDQTPGIIVVNRGLAENPEKTGSTKTGSTSPGFPYLATWIIEVGIICSAKGKKNVAAPRALERAQMYAAASRAIMVQQRDDRDIFGMIDWKNEQYDGLESTSDRTACLAYNKFEVAVPDVVSWGTGPTEPLADPAGVFFEVQEVDVDIRKVPTEAEVRYHLGESWKE